MLFGSAPQSSHRPPSQPALPVPLMQAQGLHSPAVAPRTTVALVLAFLVARRIRPNNLRHRELAESVVAYSAERCWR